MTEEDALAVIRAREREFRVHRARETDVADIVAMLRDDVLGAGREQDDLGPYRRAFAAIDGDPNHLLVVVRDSGGAPAGTMQLTLLPGLSRGGALRLQIEAVRVASGARGGGLGRAMFDWAHDYGRAEGAALVQLTTDSSRTDAHRFYEGLGYVAGHVGFKRPLA